MEKINIAFISCGRFAKFFVPLFKEHPEVEKVWVCDLIPQRAEEYSEMFDVPIIESFEKALESKEINGLPLHIINAEHCISSSRREIQPSADDIHAKA